MRSVPHAHGCTPARLSVDLAERGVTLRLAEVHAAARDILRAGNLEAKVGRIDRFTSLADVVDRFEANKDSAGAEDPLE
jgi:sulfate permease, SulP family